MMNSAIQAMANIDPSEYTQAPVQPMNNASPPSWSEPEVREYEIDLAENFEPEGKEESFLNPLPPKPVDVWVGTSRIRNPG